MLQKFYCLFTKFSHESLSHLLPTGDLLLFLPSSRRFGVMKSRLSSSLLTSPSASGRSLIELALTAAMVSHCMMPSHSFDTDLSNDSLMCRIRRSTLPCALWPPTGQVSNSTLTSRCSLYLRSRKFNRMSLQPLIS